MKEIKCISIIVGLIVIPVHFLVSQPLISTNVLVVDGVEFQLQISTDAALQESTTRREFFTGDSLVYSFKPNNTNHLRIFTLAHYRRFSHRLIGSNGMTVARVQKTRDNVDWGRVVSKKNSQNYLKRIEVTSSSNDWVVLFQPDVEYVTTRKGNYLLELQLWLWSSQSNRLFLSTPIRVPLITP